MARVHYCKEYRMLINNAKDRNSGDEKHHIKPKIMGGTKTVMLTIEEHIKAHELLMNITVGTKYHTSMATAYFLMTNTRNFGDKVDIESIKYAKKKFIKRMTGRKVSKKTREKLCFIRSQQSPLRPKGFKMSNEQKRKIGESNRGKRNGMHGKISPMKGQTHTKETKEKISKKCKGRVPWNKGKIGVYSEESLKKMRESTKKYYQMRGEK